MRSFEILLHNHQHIYTHEICFYMGNSFAVKSAHMYRDMGWVCNIKYVYLGICILYGRILCAYIQQQCVLWCMTLIRTIHRTFMGGRNVVDRLLLVRLFWPLAITGQASDARQSCDCTGPGWTRWKQKHTCGALNSLRLHDQDAKYLPQQ